MNNSHIVRRLNIRRASKKRAIDQMIPWAIALCLIAAYGVIHGVSA